MPIKMGDEITTVGLLSRLLKNYDVYVLRNLKRKYKPEELGISKQYASYVLLKNEYDELVKLAASKVMII